MISNEPIQSGPQVEVNFQAKHIGLPPEYILNGLYKAYASLRREPSLFSGNPEAAELRPNPIVTPSTPDLVELTIAQPAIENQRKPALSRLAAKLVEGRSEAQQRKKDAQRATTTVYWQRKLVMYSTSGVLISGLLQVLFGLGRFDNQSVSSFAQTAGNIRNAATATAVNLNDDFQTWMNRQIPTPAPDATVVATVQLRAEASAGGAVPEAVKAVALSPENSLFVESLPAHEKKDGNTLIQVVAEKGYYPEVEMYKPGVDVDKIELTDEIVNQSRELQSVYETKKNDASIHGHVLVTFKPGMKITHYYQSNSRPQESGYDETTLDKEFAVETNGIFIININGVNKLAIRPTNQLVEGGYHSITGYIVIENSEDAMKVMQDAKFGTSVYINLNTYEGKAKNIKASEAQINNFGPIKGEVDISKVIGISGSDKNIRDKGFVDGWGLFMVNGKSTFKPILGGGVCIVETATGLAAQLGAENAGFEVSNIDRDRHGDVKLRYAPVTDRADEMNADVHHFDGTVTSTGKGIRFTVKDGSIILHMASVVSGTPIMEPDGVTQVTQPIGTVETPRVRQISTIVAQPVQKP